MLHHLTSDRKIILASSSPRRKAILDLVGVSYTQCFPDIDESPLPTDKDHIAYITRLSENKALSAKHLIQANEVIIAADTIVYIESLILSKPTDRDQAFDYLSLLSGKPHTVYTSLTLLCSDNIATEVAHTSVKFKSLSQTEIWRYIETGEPMDKAGGYGIQGYGGQFIESITGCFFNVMGFPINLLYTMMKSRLLHWI
jgi:septum formation protein